MKRPDEKEPEKAGDHAAERLKEFLRQRIPEDSSSEEACTEAERLRKEEAERLLKELKEEPKQPPQEPNNDNVDPE